MLVGRWLVSWNLLAYLIDGWMTFLLSLPFHFLGLITNLTAICCFCTYFALYYAFSNLCIHHSLLTLVTYLPLFKPNLQLRV